MADARPKALSLHGPWPTPRVLLPGMTLKIGRHPTSDIIFEGGSVSRNHAVIKWPEGQGPTIEDLGSTNGTSLDGHFLVEGAEPLHIGSTIIVGDFTIRVVGNDGRGPPTTRAMRPAGKESGVGHVTFGGTKLVAQRSSGLEDTEPGRPARAK